MTKKIIKYLDHILHKYTPNPFILSIIVTGILFIIELFISDNSIINTIYFWGNGFWALIPFTLQMIMILIVGYVVAISPPIQKLLQLIAKTAKTPTQATIIVALSSTIGCFFNWGLGLIFGSMICKYIIKYVPTANYRLLVASAYSGFLVWHGGLSGSIPLTIATPGNFSENLIGRIIPIQETIFSLFNITALIGILIIILITSWWLSKQKDIKPIKIKTKIKRKEHHKILSPAEKLETNWIIPIIIFVLATSYILIIILNKEFFLNLNTINFIFLFLGILLHKNIKSFVAAISEASKVISPIILQFPFYAGIMAIIMSSNLATQMSEMFIEISNEKTLPLLTFYSAGLINLFIPSGGGQWAVQAPIILTAAKELNVNLALISMSVAWGDAWTNMLQPFWALPLLAVCKLKLKDIIGYCLIFLLISGFFLSTLLLIFS